MFLSMGTGYGSVKLINQKFMSINFSEAMHIFQWIYVFIFWCIRKLSDVF